MLHLDVKNNKALVRHVKHTSHMRNQSSFCPAIELNSHNSGFCSYLFSSMVILYPILKMDLNIPNAYAELFRSYNFKKPC